MKKQALPTFKEVLNKSKETAEEFNHEERVGPTYKRGEDYDRKRPGLKQEMTIEELDAYMRAQNPDKSLDDEIRQVKLQQEIEKLRILKSKDRKIIVVNPAAKIAQYVLTIIIFYLLIHAL